MPDSGIRKRLERALREALRAHDTVVVSAVRSALAALDNAQAVPAAPPAGTSSPHFAGAAAGLGGAEAERRRLGETEARGIVRAEVAERQAAAREYERRGLAGRASRLRRKASVLTSAIEADESPGEA